MILFTTLAFNHCRHIGDDDDDDDDAFIYKQNKNTECKFRKMTKKKEKKRSL